MSSEICIFDRARVRLNRDRAAASGRPVVFLHEWSMRALTRRLDDIRRSFDISALIGTNAAPMESDKIGTLVQMDISSARLGAATGPRIQADEEFLPFAEQSLDLILSNLSLHTVNDLPGALLQMKYALKPDGLLVAAMLGGETLHELRDVLMQAEMEIRGGISPRVAPFADMPQIGGLLQRAGFALPVVDSEIVTVTYDSALALIDDLRMMGEGSAIVARDRTIPNRDLFAHAAALYQEKYSDPDGRIRATFEIIFLIGWSPHDSQQKPLPRGSAQHRMADILGVPEIKV